jgi:hypothetical protein
MYYALAFPCDNEDAMLLCGKKDNVSQTIE